MGYRINFFARPIDSGHKLAWEAFLTEFSLFVICSVMAVYGWKNGSILMAVPASVVAVVCFGLIVYSIVSFFKNRAKRK